MLEVKTFSVGPLATNCYLVIQEDSQAILIDPGDDGDFLSEQVVAQGLDLQAILLTHGHFDHILGLLPLHLNFLGVPIYLHDRDHFLYQQAVTSAKYWLGEGYSPDPPPVGILPLSSPQFAIRHSPFAISVIPTPGHTPGSVCFYLPDNNLLFSGDTLFKNAVGRTDLSYSRPLDLADSLKRLGELPEDTLVYPGHGEPTTIGDEVQPPH